MSQGDLAAAIGTKQSAIARLEDPTYGKQSLAMLHRIAKIFDVAVWVELAPFSALIQRSATLTPAALTPLAYDSEFDENGEPMTSVQLQFDNSAICASNYLTSAQATPSYTWVGSTHRGLQTKASNEND